LRLEKLVVPLIVR